MVSQNETMPATKRMLARANRDAKRRRTTVVYTGGRPESKFYNQEITAHSATTQSTTNAARIAAGTGKSERIGRKVRIKSVECLISATAGVSVRAILYVPKDQSDELIPSSLTAPIDNATFWVLEDRLLQPQGSNVKTNGWMKHSFPYSIVTEYGGPNATDINRNGPRLCLVTDASATVTGHTKIWFTDS